MEPQGEESLSHCLTGTTEVQVCTQAAPYASRSTADTAYDLQQSFSAIQDANSSEFSRFASLHASYNTILYTTIHNFITQQ